MSRHWVGTWTATPAPAEGVALSAPTIRMYPRISIGGDTIRVRLSNAAGTHRDEARRQTCHHAFERGGNGLNFVVHGTSQRP